MLPVYCILQYTGSIDIAFRTARIRRMRVLTAKKTASTGSISAVPVQKLPKKTASAASAQTSAGTGSLPAASNPETIGNAGSISSTELRNIASIRSINTIEPCRTASIEQPFLIRGPGEEIVFVLRLAQVFSILVALSYNDFLTFFVP